MQTVIAGQRAGITILSATFSVEWRLISENDNDVTCASLIDSFAVLNDGDHLALTRCRTVAGKFSAAEFVCNIEPDFT